jgi:hypothetical protein
MSQNLTEDTQKKGTGVKIVLAILAAAFVAIVITSLFNSNSKIKTLEKRLQQTEDVQAIERLQYAYNYYVEHMLKQEIIDCFADSPDVLLDWLEGKWKGKEGVKKYFNVNEVPPIDFQHQLIPSAGLITVGPDGRTARGRWYAFGGVMMPSPPQDGIVQTISRSFINGIYEIGYIKEKGTWKILTIKWTIPYGVRIYDEWIMPENIAATLLEDSSAPGSPAPEPDIALDPEDLRYVTGYILPFHFTHPVTGKPTSEAKRNERLTPLEIEKSE